MSEHSMESEDILCDRVLNIIKDHENGVTKREFDSLLPSVTVVHLVNIFNKLLAADEIEIFNRGEDFVYKVKSLHPERQFKHEDLDENLIFSLIEKAGNKGIWFRDLRLRSGLPQTSINKIIKNLESKQRIKSVHSISASKRRIFMQYGLEPDRSITGGTWYSGQEFESEFIEVLNELCYKYLQQAKVVAEKFDDPVAQKNASFRASKDVCNFINELKVSKVHLNQEDIESILDTLVYDDKAEKVCKAASCDDNIRKPVAAPISHGERTEEPECSNDNVEKSSVSSPKEMQNFYRAIKPLLDGCGLTKVPCGVCPVKGECTVNGTISPSTCPYMKEWLDV